MTKKLLLVDDEEDIRELLTAIFSEDPRYQVLEAGDGDEALRLARRERPDLVILDIQLPGKSGWEVCASLKKDEETRGIIVVMLTGLAQGSHRRMAWSSGADAYVTKPFSPSALAARVGQLLGQG